MLLVAYYYKEKRPTTLNNHINVSGKLVWK